MSDKKGASLAEKSEARRQRYEARAKLEEKLGRKLKPGEEAHHVKPKGTKSCGYNNSADNIEVRSREKHKGEDSNGQRGKDSVKRKRRKE